jgi:hypothetical protein
VWNKVDPNARHSNLDVSFYKTIDSPQIRLPPDPGKPVALRSRPKSGPHAIGVARPSPQNPVTSRIIRSDLRTVNCIAHHKHCGLFQERDEGGMCNTCCTAPATFSGALSIALSMRRLVSSIPSCSFSAPPTHRLSTPLYPLSWTVYHSGGLQTPITVPSESTQGSLNSTLLLPIEQCVFYVLRQLRLGIV